MRTFSLQRVLAHSFLGFPFFVFLLMIAGTTFPTIMRLLKDILEVSILLFGINLGSTVFIMILLTCYILIVEDFFYSTDTLCNKGEEDDDGELPQDFPPHPPVSRPHFQKPLKNGQQHSHN